MLASLNHRIHEALDPLLRGHRACALLDFPIHGNVGDSAIWLGQESFLHVSGLKVVYRCDAQTYSARRLAARLGHGLILLSGGGNLGDLWPVHQQLRERVICDFPAHKIIQLPQSIHFADPRNLARTREIFNAHGDLTLIVRDAQSLEIAQREFRAPSLLCPDMALALGRLDRPTPAAVKIVWLARTDIEARHRAVPVAGEDVERVDWLVDSPNLTALVDRRLRLLRARYPRWLPLLSDTLTLSYRRLAGGRLRRGLRLLARGQVVITDRLHGFILSLLLGIPHVVLDNSYGKLKSFHATWTASSPLTSWADSPAEALSLAGLLLRRL